MSEGPSRAGHHALLGRRHEVAVLDRLLASVRSGHSAALVLRGEPGIGKTELLRHLADAAAADCRVERVAGVESEMELAFAGLHQLCLPMLGRRDRLPAPQRAALEAALGLTDGGPPDRFFVALAVLGLLSDLATARPLVCVIDDAQWLDHSSVQALAFVARRLGVESVALVFAVREADDELAGLPELELRGLQHDDARALLDSVLVGALDELVADRIIDETGGNPLALLELPRGLTATELAGGFAVPRDTPLAGRIEENYRRRFERLPRETQRLLLVAGAEPIGDPALLWRAASRLGIPPSAAQAAERDGLVEIGTHVRFRHPLVRSAVYGAASADERREAHAALAEATDPDVDPDRRAWHRANAVTVPDEEVAEELAHSAGRARSRGGVAAEAAFLERSALLTGDAARRAERALHAARCKLQAGSASATLELVALAETEPLTEVQRAIAHRLRGQVAFASSRGLDAPPLLLGAARRLERLDARLARDTYVDAIQAAMVTGALGDAMPEIARAARAAPRPPGPPGATDLLLEAIALYFTEGKTAAAPLLDRTLVETPEETWRRWPWLASLITWERWDFDTYTMIAERQVARARAGGAVTTLLPALSMLAIAAVHRGEFAEAQVLVEEAVALADATGTTRLPYAAVVLTAWQGREAAAVEAFEAAVGDAHARGEGLLLAFVDMGKAILRNGLGQYAAALSAAQAAAAQVETGFVSRVLPELVEASVRCGEHEIAAGALGQLRALTSYRPTEWARGLVAYATALVHSGDEAEERYRAALHHLSRTRSGTHRARAHLLYGEWLRRGHRNVEARRELHVAHELFAGMGAEAFAARAARELQATGESVGAPGAGVADALTAREAQIAQLARDGLSNPDIGAQLFISRRTVEYHLAKVFTKLGIRSRGELRRALPGRPAGRPLTAARGPRSGSSPRA
jgi:DNA-binding CsgD family transcriptional regulator